MYTTGPEYVRNRGIATAAAVKGPYVLSRLMVRSTVEARDGGSVYKGKDGMVFCLS